MQKVASSLSLQTPRSLALRAIFRPRFAGKQQTVCRSRLLRGRPTTRKPCDFAGLSEAADGTRTHDLLHGKQCLKRGFPLFMRDPGRSDTRGLPAITVDLGNEWVTESRRPGADGQGVQ